jgi:hypothetical protein
VTFAASLRALPQPEFRPAAIGGILAALAVAAALLLAWW